MSADRSALRGGPRHSVGNSEGFAGGEGHGRRTQSGGGHGAAVGEPFHALYPARADRPDIGTFDASRDPWAGDLEGLGREGTVATARAWIWAESVLRPVDVEEDIPGANRPRRPSGHFSANATSRPRPSVAAKRRTGRTCFLSSGPLPNRAGACHSGRAGPARYRSARHASLRRIPPATPPRWRTLPSDFATCLSLPD